MSSHRYIFFIAFLLVFAPFFDAKASLYGFVDLNPFDDEVELVQRDNLPTSIINYRMKMRENILFLVKYAKAVNPDFVTIINGGEDLLHIDEIEILTDKYNHLSSNAPFSNIVDKNAMTSDLILIDNIEAISSPNALCGDNCEFKEIQESGIRKIYIEKAKNKEELENTIKEVNSKDELLYIFSDVDEAFKNIKGEMIINENAKNIFSINDAKNISIITDDSKYNNKFELIKDINNSNYDIVIINPMFQDKTAYTKKEVESLKLKRNGLRRMIVAQMNISEANPYKYYYKKEWEISRPDWMVRASFSDNNGVITQYWNEEWKAVIAKYFKDIVSSNFDGAWLTGAENFEYFEKLTPLK